jgi:hypothetical protein
MEYLPANWHMDVNRDCLKWLPLWCPCTLHQLSLIVGAGLKNDKPFTDQVTREAAKQHMSLSFVNYMREQAETARTVRVEACLKDMVDRKNASRVTPMSEAVEKAFRDKNYLLAVFMIDSRIEEVRRRFAENIDKDGGGSLNKSEWVTDAFFQLETLEYFKDPRWVAELKKMRRFEAPRALCLPCVG